MSSTFPSPTELKCMWCCGEAHHSFVVMVRTSNASREDAPSRLMGKLVKSVRDSTSPICSLDCAGEVIRWGLVRPNHLMIGRKEETNITLSGDIEITDCGKLLQVVYVRNGMITRWFTELDINEDNGQISTLSSTT